MKNSFDTIKSMAVFAKVAEKESFTKAANELGVTRASVTYHIKKLEDRFGVTLLNRTTRSVKLTSSGKLYYDKCMKIYEEAEKASMFMDKITKEPIGTISIYCPINMGEVIVLPLLERFHRQYPKIQLDIHLTDQEPDISKENVDISIRHRPTTKQNVYITQLTTFERYICGSPDYFATYSYPTSLADLKDHAWVHYQENKTRHHAEISTNCSAGRNYFVEKGHGLASFPDYDALPRIRAGKLIRVLTDIPPEKNKVYLMYQKGDKDSAKNKLIVDFLVNNFHDEVERYKSRSLENY
ncbi:LysR family transcriptional regulator [Vibrio sp. S4M6]|uniref:LysR family transcriptional regulator n=1 Tax=Vibrio sinus TaxID=2946865 RepID=UPI00202A2621|nr:LysR family transcriptional regulator [Vibrio sinus]MCL9782045.1 LysR family transcriptional regulator [Vibrio sinus]